MARIVDYYLVKYDDTEVGYYTVLSDKSSRYDTAWGSPWDMEAELKPLGLDKEKEGKRPIKFFSDIIKDENRVPGLRRRIYKSGHITLDRRPQETGERFVVYQRSAKKGDPDYSDLQHDAPHYEGPHTPKDMREWASWYAFNKMDDGTYEAELDEAWWWGGGHNDGGTIHREIPEEWQDLPYDEFLENVVTLAAAAHYGFTPEILKSRKGLKEFFGYAEDTGGSGEKADE